MLKEYNNNHTQQTYLLHINYSVRIIALYYIYFCLYEYISSGFRGFPSLKTNFGRQDIENDAAASNTDSSCFPKSVRVYSTRIGDSETILMFIIPNRWSSFIL